MPDTVKTTITEALQEIKTINKRLDASYFAHKVNLESEQDAQKPLLTLPSLETVMASNLVGSPSSERLQAGGGFL